MGQLYASFYIPAIVTETLHTLLLVSCPGPACQRRRSMDLPSDRPLIYADRKRTLPPDKACREENGRRQKGEKRARVRASKQASRTVEDGRDDDINKGRWYVRAGITVSEVCAHRRIPRLPLSHLPRFLGENRQRRLLRRVRGDNGDALVMCVQRARGTGERQRGGGKRRVKFFLHTRRASEVVRAAECDFNGRKKV